MDEHVEARLAGILAEDVGGRQVEEGGVQLCAHGVHQHALAATLRSYPTFLLLYALILIL